MWHCATAASSLAFAFVLTGLAIPPAEASQAPSGEGGRDVCVVASPGPNWEGSAAVAARCAGSIRGTLAACRWLLPELERAGLARDRKGFRASEAALAALVKELEARIAVLEAERASVARVLSLDACMVRRGFPSAPVS